jgi:hypothetical protein
MASDAEHIVGGLVTPGNPHPLAWPQSSRLAQPGDIGNAFLPRVVPRAYLRRKLTHQEAAAIPRAFNAVGTSDDAVRVRERLVQFSPSLWVDQVLPTGVASGPKHLIACLWDL